MPESIPLPLETKRGTFTLAQLKGIIAGLQTRSSTITNELVEVATDALAEVERLQANGNAGSQATIREMERQATIREMELTAEIERLKADIERLNANIAGQQTRIDTDYREITKLQTLVRNSQNEVNRLQRVIDDDESADKVAELKEQLFERDTTISLLEEGLVRKEEELGNLRASTRRRADSDFAALNRAGIELGQLKTENEVLKESVLRLQAKKDKGDGSNQAYLDLLREISELKQRLDRAEAFNRPIGGIGALDALADFGRLKKAADGLLEKFFGNIDG